MPLRRKVLEAIFDVVDALNSQLEENEKLNKTNETPLFGENGSLNSLGFVNFLVGVEEKMEDEFGLALSLFDDSLMSSENSPLRSIGSLSDYIVAQLRRS